MIDPSSTCKSIVLVVIALLLGGCALLPSGPEERRSRKEPRLQRENMLQTAWRGRSYTTLVEAFGAPKLVMNVPGYRPVKTSVVVYGSLDQITDCIDAFTVIVHGGTGEVTVADYFCR